MSRKNAYNPNAVWHHPDYNRCIAVKALNEALETGTSRDFLTTSTAIRGRKRNSENAPQELEINSQEEDGTSNKANDKRDYALQALGTPLGQNGSAVPLPTLPTEFQRSSFGSLNNMHKRGKTLSLPSVSRQKHHAACTNASRRKSYSYGMLRSSNMGGNANATFDLFPNSTPYGMNTNLHTFFAPRTNIFAANILSTLHANQSSNGVNEVHQVEVEAPVIGSARLDAELTTKETLHVNQSSNSVSPMNGAHPVQVEAPVIISARLDPKLTTKEEYELSNFFGKLAQALPPPKEGDANNPEDPDPLPPPQMR